MAHEDSSLHPERTTSSWREEPDPETLETGVTWLPSTAHGVRGTAEGVAGTYEEAMLPTTVFAFPKHRKFPLIDTEHIRAALDGFFEVEDADDNDRAQAFANIRAAAKYYEIPLPVDSWQRLPR